MNGQTAVIDSAVVGSNGQPTRSKPKYPGVRVTCNGLTGFGPDRATAFRVLADQFDAYPGT